MRRNNVLMQLASILIIVGCIARADGFNSFDELVPVDALMPENTSENVLLGAWTLESMNIDGRQVHFPGDKHKWHFDQTKYTVHNPEFPGRVIVFEYKVILDVVPHRIVVRYIGSDDVVKQLYGHGVYGIFRIDNNIMTMAYRVAYEVDGNRFPSDFKSREGDGKYVKRMKKLDRTEK